MPEADNYIDPNIVVTQCDYGARTARTGKKAESELDDGLGSPASNLNSCSVRGEDRIDNGQSSREPHQCSESRRDTDHDCDDITYAGFIHHVRTKQQIFKAHLIAVTNMPSAEYVREVRAKQQMTEARPAAASDSPQQEEPLARADPYDTVTTPKCDLSPVYPAMQKTDLRLSRVGPDRQLFRGPWQPVLTSLHAPLSSRVPLRMQRAHKRIIMQPNLPKHLPHSMSQPLMSTSAHSGVPLSLLEAKLLLTKTPAARRQSWSRV